MTYYVLIHCTILTICIYICTMMISFLNNVDKEIRVELL